jgi:hypothetical protein
MTSEPVLIASHIEPSCAAGPSGFDVAKTTGTQICEHSLALYMSNRVSKVENISRRSVMYCEQKGPQRSTMVRKIDTAIAALASESEWRSMKSKTGVRARGKILPSGLGLELHLLAVPVSRSRHIILCSLCAIGTNLKCSFRGVLAM